MMTQPTGQPPLPTVTVVIPVYNGAMTIANCLKTVLAQTYPRDKYEVVVVENGSTDETTEIVQRYPVRLIHNEALGPAAARNRGIQESQAEIIAFTDADCLVTPTWLEELIKPYQDPTISGVGGDIQPYRHDGRTIVELFNDQFSPWMNYLDGKAEFLPQLYTPNASYRRSLLLEINGFNEKMLTGEDVEISWRIQMETGAKIVFTRAAVVYHHHRSTRQGLIRQYRQYGFGEVLLDTLFSHHPDYPRSRQIQLRRMVGQMVILPRYIASGILRWTRYLRGRITPYEATIPWLWLLAESSNLQGKIEALIATRLMTDTRPVFNMEARLFIQRMFPSRKS
ncbi:MAG: glycosyltransferase [Anaerolineae bacterium]|nr:glycosyltransferase [Anaerolineae bacterium]